MLNPTSSARQSSLPGLCPVTDALEVLALASGIEARGAFFTRREVVAFILDIAGYSQDRPLLELRLLEPSFGGGDFLLPAIERLLNVWKVSSADPHIDALRPCIRAIELHGSTFATTRAGVIALLIENGVITSEANELADEWLIQGDFLLVSLSEPFDIVVGNPPYVRQELIPDVLLAEYRSRYKTIYDRADLYIPFIERSLNLLSSRGKLGFICADRWMKNRYGGPLRKLVAEQYQLQIYVDMVDTRAFQSDVVAYPAITLIGREKKKATRIARRPSLDSCSLSRLANDLIASEMPSRRDVSEIVDVALDSQPWILDSSDQMALLRRLEKEFPLLESTGCKVGIGVATGADSAFIAPFDELNVEPDRKLRLATTRDIVSGDVRWRGLGVVNPFSDAGGLVNLKDFPLLQKYLEERKAQIAGRHCAQKTPANWYRTIDRITPTLAKTPKLLIPDIKGNAQIVYEEGRLYPHHNLYFVTSTQWDLLALQAVLMSGIARLFVSTYSTKMRGGYLRFQAQYLRRIHIPYWTDVGERLREELIRAAKIKDLAACNRSVCELYRFSSVESAAMLE